MTDASATQRPTIGSVWRENDPRDERYVVVRRIGSETLFIERVNADGSAWPKARISQTMARRFTLKGRNGFTFVRAALALAGGEE